MALVMAVVATVAPRHRGALRRRPHRRARRWVSWPSRLAAISRVGEGTGYFDLLPWFVVYGVGGGMLFPLNNVIIGALPAQRAGMASGHAQRLA